MKLWLDDRRRAPIDWYHAQSVWGAEYAINQAYLHDPHTFEAVSLDHDLGEFEKFGGKGLCLVYWMAQYDRWPREKPVVHSDNVVGSGNMRMIIEGSWHEPS